MAGTTSTYTLIHESLDSRAPNLSVVGTEQSSPSSFLHASPSRRTNARNQNDQEVSESTGRRLNSGENNGNTRSASSIQLTAHQAFPTDSVGFEDANAGISAAVVLSPPSKNRQILVLILGFLTVFITVGINQTYGIFLEVYTNVDGPYFNNFLPVDQASNRALVAFVGTLGQGLTWGGSVYVNGLMAKTESYRYITIPGAVLMSLGYCLAGSAHQIWQLLLCQGLLYGVGSSLLYFPILAVAPEYFGTHRGAAMGLIVSGVGVGGLVFAPVTQLLISQIGIRWTLRCLGMIMLVVSLPIACSVPPSRSTLRRPMLVNMSIAKKPIFVMYGIATICQGAGYAIPITYISEYSTALGYTASTGAAFVAIFNAINTVSRITMGFIADKAGRQNTLIVTTLLSSLSVAALWTASANETSKAIWIAFIIMYAVFSAGYNALFPSSASDVVGPMAYALVSGFIYFLRGLGALFGPPVGGVLISTSSESTSTSAYSHLVWYCFALLMSATVGAAAVRIFDAREKEVWKWKA